MKKLLLILLALLLLSPAMAEDHARYVEGNYIYYLTGEGAVLMKYLPANDDGSAAAEAVLPATIAGHPVISCYYVFLHFAPEERVIVEEGVTDLGEAFCQSCFRGEIVLPSSLEHIGEGSLTWVRAEITVHPDNPHFTCEDGFLIDTRTGTLLYTAPSAADKPLPRVQRLGDNCLENWHAGESVTLPDTLTAIGEGVFYDMVDVAQVCIPEGVTEIGAGAFNCTGLTEVTLPAGLTTIEPLTFSCNEFTEVVIPQGVTRIGSAAFYLCPLTRVEIPASCTFVAHDAFDPEVELVLLGEETHVETAEELEARERGIEHLEGPWGYTLTDDGAVLTDYLWGEEIPKRITVPDTLGGRPVVGVAGFAFSATLDGRWSHDVEAIHLPEGLRFLESGALYSCTRVNALHLPASLERFAENALWYFRGEIVLAEGNPHFTCEDGFLIDTRTGTLLYAAPSAPDGVIPAVRRIGAYALDSQQLPADLILPEGVEELAGYAFYDTQARSVTLPESLRVIETSAFECVNVTAGRIVVPAGVALVEYGAFGLLTPTDAEVVILGEGTRLETAEEYALRTGDFWVLQDEPIVYTRGVE